ncbi:MAG: PHP domain-containing protein [Pseudomonadota bacterium]|nr:PHP domain-containing protein [Pseudomonadota bacterium]
MHSRFSDGSLSPTELMQAAATAKLDRVALTDHDTIDGLAEARQAAVTLGLDFINGIELSAQWIKPSATKPMSVHIVGLGMTDLPQLQAALQTQQQVRAARGQMICQRLQPYIQRDPWPEVLAMADGQAERVTRAHIAEWLLQQGLVQRHQQAFDRWLGEKRAAHVPLQWMSMANAVQLIHACGGQSVLAHPTRYRLSANVLKRLVADFVACGGRALELPSFQEPSATRAMIDRLVTQYDLRVSTSSDFHGASMPWIKLGHVPNLKAGQVGVWEQLV